MARYLVTGGCGFIGSHIVDELINQQHEVTVLDNLSTGCMENLNPEAHFWEGDIRNTELVADLLKQTDGCFHLAAIPSVEESNQKWEETHSVNQTGTVNLFAAAARLQHKPPIVYASSAAVYGDTSEAGNVPLTEQTPPAPQTAYGVDKYGCELHAQVGQHVHGLYTCGLRFFNVYGPRQDPKSPYSGVISIFTEKICRGEPITIHGDGQQTRDFIFVADVAAASIAAMHLLEESLQPVSHVINVCTGHATSVNQLATELESLLQKRVEHIRSMTREGDIRASCGNRKQMNALLNLRQFTDLRTGLEKTVTAQKQDCKLRKAS